MKNKKNCEFSVVMPCLNEEKTLGSCIGKIKDSFKGKKTSFEIVVADNGSKDESIAIAKNLGARVVHVEKRGYGAALNQGISESFGKYIIMGDSDDSYNFSKLQPFIDKLEEGCDLVMGNRFAGRIKPGAMPFLHKIIGNPLFSWLGRIFFSSNVGDFYCGLRGFSKVAWKKMNLQSTGMEYAIEMVIKSSLLEFSIAEIPIILHKDGRGRPPHLRTWQDGWRTLRFILLYAPGWLFYLPGFSLISLGFLFFILASTRTYNLFGLNLDVHTLLVSTALLVIGFQIILFGQFTKLLIYKLKLLPLRERNKPLLTKINSAQIFLISFLMFGLGVSILLAAFFIWYRSGFGRLDYSSTMRIVIPSVFLLQLGTQLFFNAFFLDILLLPSQKNRN